MISPYCIKASATWSSSIRKERFPQNTVSDFSDCSLSPPNDLFPPEWLLNFLDLELA